MLRRFHSIPERDGQTYGQTGGRTDRIAISISRVSVLTRDNKKLSYRWQTARCWFVKLLTYGRTFCRNM